MGTPSTALIADIAFIIGSFYTHSEIDNVFANETPDFDMISFAGGLLEDLMDGDVRGADRRKIEQARADVGRALARHSLSYQRGAAVAAVPARAS